MPASLPHVGDDTHAPKSTELKGLPVKRVSRMASDESWTPPVLRCGVYTSTQRVSTTPSRRGHWRPGRPSWEYQLTNGKGRIRRSFPTLTVALSRQDQICSVRDSLTLLRYRLWAVTGSAEDALRRLMPP